MIAPTHIGFSLSLGLLLNSPHDALILLAVGSVLPDIDHPKSAVGRLFHFISVPLHKQFGHRGFVHALTLWVPIIVASFFFFKPLFYLAIGALTHCLLDMANISGVALFYPLSERICVFGSRKHRIAVGSKAEWTLMLIFFFTSLGGFYLYKNGGLKQTLTHFIGSYKTAYTQYTESGKTICHIKGRLRWPDGTIQQGSWLIIGTEKNQALAILDQDKNLIKIPKQAIFLKASLIKTDQIWSTLVLEKPTLIHADQPVFMQANKTWYQVPSGKKAFGTVIYRGQIEIPYQKNGRNEPF